MKSIQNRSIQIFLTFSFIHLVLIFNVNAQQFTNQSLNLTGVSNGKVSFGDCDNDGDLDIILNGDTTKISQPQKQVTYIYQNNGNNYFQKLTNLNLLGISNGKSTWLDIDNDDDMDIVLMGYSTTRDVEIYRNDGNNSFTSITPIGLGYSLNNDVSAGDIDNDGKQDILKSGDGATSIYRNNGNYTFDEVLRLVPSVNYWNCSVFGDYNNDGYLDFFISGNNITKLYKNTGNGVFFEEATTFPQLFDSSADWGDFNNDGYIDLLISGSTSSEKITRIYKNNGNGTFTELSGLSLLGVANGSCAWADYNNDGRLDFIITGERNVTSTKLESVTKLYENIGNDSFAEASDKFPGVTKSSIEWGDCDNDGDLDLLISGASLTDSSKITRLFINNSNKKNTTPQVPTNLYSTTNDKTISLSWDKSTDSETPQNGLSYNIRVGATSNGTNAVSPMSGNNGYRKIVAKGNTGSLNSYKIENLLDGTYFWSVQTLDNGFLGSPFSTEGTFTKKTSPPTVQASNLTFKNVGAIAMSLKWQKGDANRYAVFIKKGSEGTIPLIVNNTTYTANKRYKNGSQIGTSGWYCIYNGNADTASVEGLESETTYSFLVLGYNGLNTNEKYLTSSASNNPSNQTSTLAPFIPSNIFLTGVSSSAADFGDFDNDGDLDIILAGDSIRNDNNSFIQVTKLYENINSNYTEKTGTNFQEISAGSIKWGDYNNDGSLDILLAGNKKTIVYKNNSDGSFTEQTGIILPGMNSCSAIWGDFDNDGYQDIALSGYTGSVASTSIFRNNKDDTFTSLSDTAFATFGRYTLWADLDNDRDLDFVISGPASSYKAAIYKNNDDGTFTQVNTDLVGVNRSGITCADYDNDGDLDIFSASDNNNYSGLFLYINKGNFNFEKKILYTGFDPASNAIGDYNNDGNIDASYGYYVFNNKTGNFIRNIDVELGNIYWGTDLWGDYDNDKDLDLLQTGYDFDISGFNTRVSRIFKNTSLISNTSPTSPIELSCEMSGNNAILRWHRSSDKETPVSGLSYNLALNQIGGEVGQQFNISPMSDLNNGYRKVVDIGNVQQDTCYILKGIPTGSYKFKVQAIDNGYLGSLFSSDATFNVENINFSQATNILVDIKDTNAKISWTNGSGEKRAVFIKSNTSKIAYPFNNHSYIANSEFGKGTKTEFDAWFCIHNGTGNEVSITGLSPLTEYRIMVCEYTGSAGNEIYSGATAQGNPLFFKTANINTTGISDIKRDDIFVYPNPTRDYIFINAMADPLVNLSIIDLNGKVILNANSTRENEPVCVKSIKKGIYIVKLQFDKYAKYVKIVVIE